MRLTGDQKVRGLVPCQVQQYFFMEIDHEIFYMVILSLLLIQEGQVLAKECAQILVNHLEG